MPLPSLACVTEMRQAYEQAAAAAGLEVGEPELFVPFDSGIASPCSECEGALLPKCACMSTVCVALRDEGTRERRRAKDAKCATPTVRCKQCPGFKTLARTHCLSAQCVARRATKTLSKQAGGAEQVSGKQKGAETGPSGANSSAKKHTAMPAFTITAALQPAAAPGPMDMGILSSAHSGGLCSGATACATPSMGKDKEPTVSTVEVCCAINQLVSSLRALATAKSQWRKMRRRQVVPSADACRRSRLASPRSLN